MKVKTVMRPGSLCTVVDDRGLGDVEIAPIDDPVGDMDLRNLTPMTLGVTVIVVSDRETFTVSGTYPDDVMILTPDCGLAWIRGRNLRTVIT